ncbi:amidohydrolase family protein [Acinetobacter puyangensis]|nr:amidohydrolase family protein [Acinetobacter puyangensis]
MPMTQNGKDIPVGEIFIENDKITAIGTQVNAKADTIIDANGGFVLPGFVDTHSHLWVNLMRGQFRNAEGKFFPISNELAKNMTPQDTYLAMYSGALELISNGITTTADFFDNIHGPAWGEAGLKALQDSGIRAIMYYGGPDKTTIKPIDLNNLQKLKQQTTSRVNLGLAWRIPRNLQDETNWAMRDVEYKMAIKQNLPIQVHISGDANAMFNALIQRKYLSPAVTVVHATDATPQQLDALEQTGAALSLTPLSEHRVGYGLTHIEHFSRVSRQGLGIDGNTLAGSGDMFDNIRLAALTMSGYNKDETKPDPRQLLELATRRGAEAIGLGKITGSLAVGKRADLQIIQPNTLNMSGYAGGDPAALLVYSAKKDNISVVIIDGKLIVKDGKFLNISTDEVIKQTHTAAKQLLQRAQQP